MKQFAQLFIELDSTTRTNEKVAALERYFRAAPPEDAAWALQFLIGQRPPRAVTTTQLRAWAAEESQLPDWLIEESYQAVGDLGETLALLLPSSPSATPPPLHTLVGERLLPLRQSSAASQRELIVRTWRELPDPLHRFLWHKLLGGSFRVGVARTLVARALALVAGVPADTMAHRLMGGFTASAGALRRLLDPAAAADDPGRPYPFHLAHPLESREALGALGGWRVEWKWDGIRAQLIRRAGRVLLWSRGEELINDAFPELCDAARCLPEGTVLDGEVLAWRDDKPMPFHALQRRIGRVKPSAKLRGEVPVVFLAYDLIEQRGEDIRRCPLEERMQRLEALLNEYESDEASPRSASAALDQGELFHSESTDAATAKSQRLIVLSRDVAATDWDALAALVEGSRARGVEGVMLKRRDSPYGVGREPGAWWKWKVEPLSVDAVLVASQPGHGKRAGLFTDHTFAVWRGDKLVPFAKAYSGLGDAEIREVDAFVRAHTLERHGPLRTVTPELVFEIAFEGIRESARHASGIAVRFPRIARWRRDKTAAQADTLETLRALLQSLS